MGLKWRRMLGIPEVIVPPYPGITSAMGLLTTDLKYDTIRTAFQISGNVDLERLNAIWPRWGGSSKSNSRPTPASTATFVRDGDLRYVGQGYELEIPCRTARSAKRSSMRSGHAFTQAHKREYGHFFAESPIEIVNVRVGGSGQLPKIAKLTAPQGRIAKKAQVKTGTVCVPHRRRAAAIRNRVLPPALLPVGESFAAPRSCCRQTRPRSSRPGRVAINDAGRQPHLTVSRGRAMMRYSSPSNRPPAAAATRVDPVTGA